MIILVQLGGAPWWVAVSLVGVMGLTDFLDGRLARRYKLAGARGARLDEANDKLALALLFGFFVYAGRLWWLVFGVFFAREAYITWFRSRVRRTHPQVDLSAKLSGKIKTTFQFVLAGLLCLPLNRYTQALSSLVTLIMLSCSYFSAWRIVTRAQEAMKSITDC
jgi:CDP-diacylglycerol--glycerol-3-phosphate 3-phosphatidyltransferase